MAEYFGTVTKNVGMRYMNKLQSSIS